MRTSRLVLAGVTASFLSLGCEHIPIHMQTSMTVQHSDGTVDHKDTQWQGSLAELPGHMEELGHDLTMITNELEAQLKKLTEVPPPGKVALKDLSPGLAKYEDDANVNFVGHAIDAKTNEPIPFEYVKIGVPDYDAFFQSAQEIYALLYECTEAISQMRQLAAKINVGLSEIGDRRVALLSGGQKRRLAMAMEMVSSPSLLLCDEVTSGLDPKSEDEIVHLMHDLSRSDKRIVLSVTHSLQHVALYDSVIVLYQGHLVYHGTPKLLAHYFGITNPADLYPRLAQRTAGDWHRSWEKYRASYYEQSKLPAIAVAPAPVKSDEKTGMPEMSEEETIERLRKIVEEKDKASAEKRDDAPDDDAHKSETVVPNMATEASVRSSAPSPLGAALPFFRGCTL